MQKNRCSPRAGSAIFDEQLRTYALADRSLQYVAGLDEAGRGPLSGPVTAGAVILPVDCFIPGLNDSKKLSEKRRLVLENEIKSQALAWSCVSVNHRIIDRINILEASRLAMCRAVQHLEIEPQHLLIDAVELDLDIPATPIIHGDALSISIAATSIVAKNTRDRLMVIFDKKWPEYGLPYIKVILLRPIKQRLRYMDIALFIGGVLNIKTFIIDELNR